MQDQRIADEEPEEASTWPANAAGPDVRARDEWLRRHVRRLLDQVGAMPSPAFLRRERSAVAASTGRTVQGVAAIVFFMLVVCLALTTWQWRAARGAEDVARTQALRNAAARDFLSGLLLAAAGSSSTDPTQRPRMKEVLDDATPNIVQQFANDPRAQSELLGLVAALYRDIGEFDSRRALLALQRTSLRRVYGEAHSVLIRNLLDEAQSELARGDASAAISRLVEADPLIAQSKLDDDPLRARWWMLRSDALSDTAAGAEALDRAIAAFEKERPVDARLGEALARKARRLLSTQPAQAEQLFERVIAMSAKSAAGVDRRAALLGLAQAHEIQGEYAEALQTLDQARKLARRELVADAQYAWTLHREGQREEAQALFDSVMPQVASASAGQAWVRTYYAESLAAEGRPMQAIPLLESAAAQASRGEVDALDPQRTQLALGDAYDRAGLWWKARETIKSSLEQRLQHEPAISPAVAEARERWGRFLLDRGDVREAQAQFEAVLDQAGERNLERVVLAYGGLARVALARHDWDAALTASTHAVVGFENLVGARDVRTGPYLWLIHAEALRNVDDYASARIWATRALDASRRYDAPDAPSIREAQDMMSRLLG